MRRARLSWPVLALGSVLALSACGGLPRPFEGNPGATARRLAQPPPVRLAVPPPTDALLDDADAATYAGDVAAALAALEIPAVAALPHKGDWVLRIGARLQGPEVAQRFEVLDPAGKSQGDVEGASLPAGEWNSPTPAMLKGAADAAAPGISGLLTRIQAMIARSDPNSLVNRAAHIYVAPVTGAPGDGNAALARQMRQALPMVGEQVQDVPDNADLSVRGVVRVTPKPNSNLQTVEIQWIVDDARGERGRVVQLNEVPRGTLDGYWGDVAVVVAQQGAAGVRGVIEGNARAAAPPSAAATPAAPAPAPAPAPASTPSGAGP